LGPHERQHVPGKEKRPAQVDRHHLIPASQIVLVDIAAPADAGIVDQDIGRSKPLHRCLDHVRHCLSLNDIGLDCQRFPGFGPDGGNGLLQGGLPPVADDHPDPDFSQSQGHRPADAAAAAGDNSDLPVQIFHRLFLLNS
jgi:hypothetical protein